MDYYLHRNMSFALNYFGHIGNPFQVSYLRYLLYKILGFRATAVPKGTSTTEVLVHAAITDGAHPTSYHVKKIRKNGHDWENSS